jgi:hypothetical protein
LAINADAEPQSQYPLLFQDMPEIVRLHLQLVVESLVEVKVPFVPQNIQLPEEIVTAFVAELQAKQDPVAFQT